MEKPSKIHFKSSDGLKSDIEKFDDKNYNDMSDTVSIVCLRDAITKVIGAVTGKIYVFYGGNPVNIDVRDKDNLLNKKRAKACCGGKGGEPIFKLAE